MRHRKAWVAIGSVAGAIALASPAPAAENAAPAAAGAAVHTCHGEVATIVGTDGDDVLEGTPEADVIVGLKGSDVIHSHGGADVVCTGASPKLFDDDDAAIITDHAYGGKGRDVLVAGAGNDAVYGGKGRDLLLSRAYFGYLYGGPGDDELRAVDPDRGAIMIGGTGDDIARGGPHHDTWAEGDTPNGSDVFFGGGGDDYAQATGEGRDRYEGGPGRDQLRGGSGPDTLDGGSGNDILLGQGDDDLLKGGKGTDLGDYSQASRGRVSERSMRVDLAKGVATGFGHDRLRGVDDIASGYGADKLIGDEGPNHFYLSPVIYNGVVRAADDDRIDGNGGRDTVELSASEVVIDLGQGTAEVREYPGYLGRLTSIENAVGSGLPDVLIGSARANRLVGRGSGDVMRGRDGDDVLVEDFGDDQLRGGDGHDTVDFSAWDQNTVFVGVSVDLASGVAQGDGADDLTSIESVIGSEGNDQLLGNDKGNRLRGRAGDDHLEGRAGDDELDGGPGVDTLDGGPGDDICTTTDGDARWRC